MQNRPFVRKRLDNFIVIDYNRNIEDVPFSAVVETFWPTVDEVAAESTRSGEVAA